MKTNLHKRLDIFFPSLPLCVQVRLKVLYGAILYLTLPLKAFDSLILRPAFRQQLLNGSTLLLELGIHIFHSVQRG